MKLQQIFRGRVERSISGLRSPVEVRRLLEYVGILRRVSARQSVDDRFVVTVMPGVGHAEGFENVVCEKVAVRLTGCLLDDQREKVIVRIAVAVLRPGLGTQ